MATTVTAYASGNADPYNNPSIPIQVAQAVLPFAAQAYGAVEDTADPGNLLWTYSWSIISTNYTGAPAINTPAGQNTTVTVDEWVNIRLFLTVRNDNLGTWSEQDPAVAPDSAFVVIAVSSTSKLLERLADGERNFIDTLDEWPTAIEDLALNVPAHDIDDHDTTATGAQLDTLTDGSNASGLHSHSGSDILPATTAAYGVVQLENAPAGAIPRVITKERVSFTASTFQSIVTGGSGASVQDDIRDAGVSAPMQDGIFLFRADDAMDIVTIYFYMNDGGETAPVTKYTFAIDVGTIGDYAADMGYNTFKTFADIAPAGDYEPFEFGAKVLQAVAAGEWIRVRCTVGATTPGHGLHCSIICHRHV